MKGFLIGMICIWLGYYAGSASYRMDVAMRHQWVIEHMNCRLTTETRKLLGVTEEKWECEKQDAFWRPITE